MQKYNHAFGKNDIRGIYNEDITEELYFNIGIGFVEWLKKQSGQNANDMTLTVCRDARLHSPQLSEALISGVTSTGAKVINLGLAPTPIGYYSEVTMDEVISAMIITASHNPSEYNGLKMTYKHQTLNEKQIQEVKELTYANLSNNILPVNTSAVESYDIIPEYIKDMKSRFGEIGKGLKIVVDSANATGGIVGPKLYKELGCEVIELYSMPDGRFPHHHPNPSDEKTLVDIKKAVVANRADLGIAFDGDSDRIGVIDSEGKSLTGDKLLLIYAQDIIKEYNAKGVKPFIVSEVKCSQVLYDSIDELGGISVMCKTGHGYIKSKMKEVGALLAGEMSGHTFFKDKYYGFDDAIYAGCRIIEILAEKKKVDNNFKIADLLEPFNKIYCSSEVRLSCPNSLKKSTLESFDNYISKNPNFFGSKIKEIITIDGMRIVFEQGGFALIRQSNTEPVFTLRFEALNSTIAQEYEEKMVSKLVEIIKENAIMA